MNQEPPRKGLGRGLSALLAEDPDDQPALDRLRVGRTVAIESLTPNRFQPRRDFDAGELEDLTQSIRRNGILMPILVRRVDETAGGYEIVAGERRWRAAQAAQLYEVPVIIKEIDDAKALELALIENIQRQDLSPLEEAEGYRRLLEEFANTQEDLAAAVGKSRSHVANMMRLLGLPDSVKALLRSGSLSAGHGRALLGAADPEAQAVVVVRRGLNVRQTEQLVKKPPPSPGTEAAAASGALGQDADTRAMEKQLSDKLGLAVKISHRGERGEVRIAFTSLDQFDEILRRLSQQPPS